MLVVDDNPDARESISLVLRHAGLDVEPVASVAEAVAAIARQPPELILTDIAMPSADGFNLLEHVRTRRGPDGQLRRIPVVAITAYGSADAREQLAGAGFDACLIKPVAGNRLLQVVADTLRARS